MSTALKYRYTNYSLFLIVCLAIAISWYFKWNNAEYPVNFMGGDAKDYYSGLVSLFITHDFAHQVGNDWFLLNTGSGVINVHPIGVSILLLPFFGLAYIFAAAFQYPLDGYSFPFQLSVAAGALFYAILGLVYLKKLFQLNAIDDRTSALVILLLFFGTNLLHYTLSEAGMSHVYSFSLISAFLYHSCRFVSQDRNKNLLFSFVILGLIFLVRPNNILIAFSVFIWFRSWEFCKTFFVKLFRNKVFYLACLLCILTVSMQNVVWYIQSKTLFHNTYVADGFYWLHPQILKMLFGFDGGFFIYTPLCLLFLGGLIFLYKESKFSFFAAAFFLLGLFYFFASYWAYNYFDGLGIRVLVDYYALFSFIGAKLFTHLLGKTLVYNSVFVVAGLLLTINLIYTYQANSGILLRAGMTFAKWKYIFLRTSAQYRDVLGGSHELKPYSAKEQKAVLTNEVHFDQPFDFSEKDYGLAIHFDSIGFFANRLQLKIDVSRKELSLDASRNAALCVALEDGETHKGKFYTQFRLNEAPATECCGKEEYQYTTNVTADFKPGDKLSVFVWNKDKKDFLIDKFSIQVYNYSFQIN